MHEQPEGSIHHRRLWKKIEAVFLGKIPVCYHLPEQKDYIPGNYETAEIILSCQSGEQVKIESGVLEEEWAMAVRAGDVVRIDVTIG